MVMKQFLILLFLISINLKCWSQESDYSQYHKWVNQAEVSIFLNGDADSALYYYDKVFSQFEFVFVKDLVNAAQIAYFSNKPFRKYLIKGFDFGLKIDFLSGIKLFDPIYPELSHDKELIREYELRRPAYLKGIDTSYLLYAYKRGIIDQLDKQKPVSEYDQLKRDGIEKWITLIESRGFPGTKKIGIDDKNLFAELNKPGLDIDGLKTNYSNSLNYYSADENILSSSFIIVILLHNQCSFNELNPLLRKLILNGEIHPREAGLLYDNTFRNTNGKSYQCPIPDPKDGVFHLNMFCDYNKFDCPPTITDSLREQWLIVPLAVDKAKEKFEKQYGFRLFYGYWNCL